MKKLFSLLSVLLILASVEVWSQNTLPDPNIPFDKETQTIKFSRVVQTKGTKDDLFKRCVYWLNGFYKEPTRVTLIRDVPTGKIVGRHTIPIYQYDSTRQKKERIAKVYYTFTIKFKDGKYKWQIDQLEVYSRLKSTITDWVNKNDPKYQTEYKYYLQQIVDFIDYWSKDLEEKMKPEKPATKEDDDW